MHIYQIDTIYRINRSKNSSGVIWGHRGSKGHFHLKGYNSSMLPSMTIRHIHVYTLETPLPMLWGQMPTWGHLGSQWSKRHFHQNCSNLSILNSLTIILKHMHELETPTYVVGSKINLGSLGILQKRAGFVSFQRHTVLVLLLSSICQHANISDTLGPIMLVLGQSNKFANVHF